MLPQGQIIIQHVGPLGFGGLGTVDEVVVIESNSHYPIGTRLARKRLNQKWKDNPTARERFEREITALSRMNHQSIVPFRGQNLPKEERFYLMPLYKRSVRKLINENPGGFIWTDVARLGIQIADAMHYAHQQGYIHRDLKPENLLQADNDHIVISDWGLGYFVHQYSQVFDLTIGPMGTMYYCSGEQWTTGKCDARGDIYSLGIVLAELVRGLKKIAVLPGCGLGQEDAVIYKAKGTAEFNSYLRSMTALHAQNRPNSMYDVMVMLNSLVHGI